MNMEERCQFLLFILASGVEAPDFQHLCVTQLGKAALGTLGVPATSFGGAVVIIVGGAARKKMPRANAGAIIAMMADQHPIGYRAIGKFIGNSVGMDCSAGVNTKGTVARVVPSSGPYPALAGFVHLRPKSLSYWLGVTLEMASWHDYILALLATKGKHFMKSFMERECEFLARGGKFIVPLPSLGVAELMRTHG